MVIIPLTTARLREVECSSENIRLRVTSQVHCCTVSEVGRGRQHFGQFVLHGHHHHEMIISFS